MLQQIKINDKAVDIASYEEEVAVQEDSSVNYLRIKFVVQVVGESAQGEIYQLIRTPFEFVRVNGQIIKAELSHHALTYKGDELGEDTPITYKVEIKEIVTLTEATKDDTIERFSEELIEKEVMDSVIEAIPIDVVAMVELLIQKGVITEEEYLQQLSSVYNRQVN